MNNTERKRKLAKLEYLREIYRTVPNDERRSIKHKIDTLESELSITYKKPGAKKTRKAIEPSMVVEGLNEGLTIKEIAAKNNVSQSLVFDVKKKSVDVKYYLKEHFN